MCSGLGTMRCGVVKGRYEVEWFKDDMRWGFRYDVMWSGLRTI